MVQPTQPIQTIQKHDIGNYIIEITEHHTRQYGYMIIKNNGDGTYPIVSAKDGYFSINDADSLAQNIVMKMIKDNIK